MIDWTASMQHDYEYYIVDPSTWKDSQQIKTVKKFNISRDKSLETLGSATVDCTEVLDECYVRAYLMAIQNGVTNKVPLGTFLVQTPGVSFDGKLSSSSLDAYTPLIELKGSPPPVGYSLVKGAPIMGTAHALCRENMRAPIISSGEYKQDETEIEVEVNGTPKTVIIASLNGQNVSGEKLLESDFVANLNDTWLSFISDLIANAKYELGLDELGQVIFEPVQDLAALRSVWTYNDDNSSILYPDISDERDLYGIPNVVEVVYSEGLGYKVSRVVNDDPNSPVSTVNRGREVVYRDTDPSFTGIPTQGQLDAYAYQLLKNLSALEHKITYKHSYCPVRLGDCVTLNYKRAGLSNIRAKVISQSISCETGCPVEETAVYTTNLWR